MKSTKLPRRFLIIAITVQVIGTAVAQPPRLSLKEAIELALGPEGSLRIEAALSDVEGAEARVDQNRSSLLPHVRAGVGQRRLTINLESVGLGSIGGPFGPPKLVGPFSSWDARGEVQQTVFDWNALKRYDASKSSLEATRLDLDRVEEQVAREVALSYLEALRAKADVEGARSDVTLARSLLATARRRLQAGAGIRIEETRAAARLSNQEQRLLVAEHRLTRANLNLQRAIGAEIGGQIQLSDTLEDDRRPLMSPEQAWEIASSSRSDIRALQAHLRGAEQRLEASRGRRLPSVLAFGDYGSSGIYPNDSIPTWTAGVRVNIPVFEGGRLSAEQAEQHSRVRRIRAQLADQIEAIKLDVRLALTAARVAVEQVAVARTGLELASEELDRARRRYEAGVTGSLEVTEAQTSLERARESLNQALFESSAARVEVEVAAGTLLASAGIQPQANNE